jgi:hypothetical protein
MTVGSPTVHSKTNGTNPGLAYTCLQTVLTRGSETPDFPQQPCPAGIMVRTTIVLFPTLFLYVPKC